LGGALTFLLGHASPHFLDGTACLRLVAAGAGLGGVGSGGRGGPGGGGWRGGRGGPGAAFLPRGRAWLLVAMTAASAAAAPADPRAAELEALRRAIEQHRERGGAFEREERGLLETLEEMDRALEALGADAAR